MAVMGQDIQCRSRVVHDDRSCFILFLSPPCVHVHMLCQEEISSLMKKSDKLEKTHKHLEHISEILRSSEAEVASLKEKLTSLESQKSNKISLQRPKNQANNPKRVQRVQQLEKQVKDLEKVIQKRFPNSLAALITAANCPDQDAS